MASTAARRWRRTRVRSEAWMATSVPVPMARPRSAWASAAASLTPSPTMATTWPSDWSRLTTSTLSAGRTSAMTWSMPTWEATDRAAARLSPVSSTGVRPSSRGWVTAAAGGGGRLGGGQPVGQGLVLLLRQRAAADEHGVPVHDRLDADAFQGPELPDRGQGADPLG